MDLATDFVCSVQRNRFVTFTVETNGAGIASPAMQDGGGWRPPLTLLDGGP